MASGSSCKETVKWTVVTPTGPSMSHHVGCVIGNTLYVHGGIEKKGSTTPLNKQYSLDLDGGVWKDLTHASSPALSHHVCVTVNNRYMVLVGGWNGKQRISDVYVYDVEKQNWLFPKVSGFPAGAGLSSHTATLLQNGDLLILGREGSLRMQRRGGNAYLLSGSIESGHFKWNELAMNVASRSGHTASCVGSTLYIIGGRDDKQVEMHLRVKIPSEVTPNLLTKISGMLGSLKPLAKCPCGRRNHVSIAGKDGILIHGGETFDGRSREPVGEIYYVRTKPHLEWYKLGTQPPGREGHIMCGTREHLLIHGGQGGRGVIYGDVYQLEI